MKKFFLFCAAIAFSASSAFSQACETFNDGPYVNFNNQGGAPCADPAPATNAITAFEIWKAEAYLMSGVQAGATYEFSACNSAAGVGLGGTVWNIDYTIVAPSGAIDAFGLDAGSICAITWVATESGEYTIIINEAGNCGATTGLTVDNGFPQITYLGGGSCPDPVTACEAGTFDPASIPTEVCPFETFDYASTGVSIPNSPVAGEYAITFDAVPGSGAGGPFGASPDPSFILTLGAPGAGAENEDVLVSIDNVLTTAGGAPALTGEWILTGRVLTGGASCDSLPPVTVDFLTFADAGCTEVTACEAGIVDQAGIDNTLCPDETTDYNLTGFTIPNSPVPGEYILEFDPIPGSGSGGPFGAEVDPAFFISLDALPGSENADATTTIGATLVDALGVDFPPLLGEWSIRGAVLTGTALCDSVPAVVIDFLDENEPACNVVPCELPYPAVPNSSLGLVTTPNGGISFSWTPISGQIGCQVNVRVGDPAAPTVQGTFIVGGANASVFNVGPAQLTPYPFQTINFRVRCGCQQFPSVIAGPYSGFASIVNFPPAGSAISVVSDQDVKHLDAEVEGNRLTPAVPQTMDNWAPVYQNPNLMMGTLERRSNSAKRTSFDVFPNPTAGSVNLNYAAAAEGMVNVRVFDLVGKAVADYSFAVNEGENFINLDLSSFEKGLYVVEVLEGGTSSTAKVVLK